MASKQLVSLFIPVLLLYVPASFSSCVNDGIVTGNSDCVYVFTTAKNSDGSCPSRVEAARQLISSSSDDFLLAYYPFDCDAFDRSGNSRNGRSIGNSNLYSEDGVCGGSRFFNGANKIEVEAFRSYSWGSAFSVSVWFKRTGQFGNYQGIISNGYGNTGSWEIRMGRENGGTMLGGGVVTAGSGSTWDYVHLNAAINAWHHVVMSYDGGAGSLKYYLDGVQQPGDNDCCSGPILTRNNPVTIGQAGTGTTNEYFYGYIDEVKIYSKALSAQEVHDLYENACD